MGLFTSLFSAAPTAADHAVEQKKWDGPSLRSLYWNQRRGTLIAYNCHEAERDFVSKIQKITWASLWISAGLTACLQSLTLGRFASSKLLRATAALSTFATSTIGSIHFSDYLEVWQKEHSDASRLYRQLLNRFDSLDSEMRNSERLAYEEDVVVSLKDMMQTKCNLARDYVSDASYYKWLHGGRKVFQNVTEFQKEKAESKKLMVSQWSEWKKNLRPQFNGFDNDLQESKGVLFEQAKVLQRNLEVCIVLASGVAGIASAAAIFFPPSLFMSFCSVVPPFLLHPFLQFQNKILLARYCYLRSASDLEGAWNSLSVDFCNNRLSKKDLENSLAVAQSATHLLPDTDSLRHAEEVQRSIHNNRSALP
eukprot:ANDGO_01901.mRNA.1 hypothetical protein